MKRTDHIRGGRRAGARARGFTLLEALLAATVLGVTVLAVVSAVGAAQSVSFDGQKRILAAIAADDYMIEMMTLAYEDVRAMDGVVQAPGAMETVDGQAYPGSFWSIGRRVDAREIAINEPGLGVTVRGLDVTVTGFDTGADLAQVSMFIPEPADL